MTTMSISLPDDMKAFVESQVTGGSYGSASEYVRDLVRMEQRRQARERVENEFLEALKSPGEVVTPEYWAALTHEARELVKARKAANR